jgi:ubiquinone/menaquinone biosynthesis C-methylase UbiE
MVKPLIDWSPDVYTKLAKHYDLFLKLTFPIGSKGQAGVLQDMNPGLLLDVACGTGTVLAQAYALGMQCFGNDNSSGMLEQARLKVPGAHLEQGSFYELPYADGQFDYVVETNAVSGVGIHFEKVIDEMLRVCKMGGEVRIGDYAKGPRESAWIRLVERIGLLIGDHAHDYVTYFESLGHHPQVRILGWYGMYQVISVCKTTI